MSLNSLPLRISYNRFGFIPRDDFRHNLYGRLFGHPNLLKRLQARDIMEALALKDTDIALDFGCGMGYFTVEMAKLARKTIGLDIWDGVKEIPIPPELNDRIEFRQASGTEAPFPDAMFDVVLASEVLPMLKDPSKFLAEIHRVLKPGGRLVISNGAGHPAIRKAFEKSPLWFRWLRWRYRYRMPPSYDEYCKRLQQSFGTEQDKYFGVADIHGLVESSGFEVQSTSFSPGYLAGAWCSITQLRNYVRGQGTYGQRYFALKYHLLRILSGIDWRRHEGGIICVATRA